MAHEYEVFLGCSIPSRFNNYEASMRVIADELDIKLLEFDGASCCGTVVLKSIDALSWLSMSGRNIAIAEKRGHNIVTPCNGCFGSLKDADHVLQEHEDQRDKLNEILSPTRRFHALYDKVYRMDFLEDAWEQTKRNKGSAG
ncbi:MAG: heterodisulfide reductase-related iron-sulfur binding cluster, partial [Promethearchaeati archaeon]